MKEPPWHVVRFNTLEDLGAIPASMCCNCGTTTAAIELRPVRFRYEDAFGGRGGTLTARLPTCAGCAPTLRMPAYGSATESSLSGVAMLVACIAVPVTLAVVMPPARITVLALGALAVVVGGWFLWRRRAPAGGRVTNYKPVRFEGFDGTVDAAVYLAFANRDYAALVSEHNRQLGPAPVTTTEGGLPRARIITRRR